MKGFRPWGSLCALGVVLVGCHALSGPADTLRLRWQWGGESSHRVAARVRSVKEQGGGLFGIHKTMSIADNLPNARVVTAEIVAGPGANGRVELLIPANELPSTASGDMVAIAYTANNRAVCIAPIPASVPQTQMEAWLSSWRCAPGATKED